MTCAGAAGSRHTDISNDVGVDSVIAIYKGVHSYGVRSLNVRLWRTGPEAIRKYAAIPDILKPVAFDGYRVHCVIQPYSGGSSTVDFAADYLNL